MLKKNSFILKFKLMMKMIFLISAIEIPPRTEGFPRHNVESILSTESPNSSKTSKPTNASNIRSRFVHQLGSNLALSYLNFVREEIKPTTSLFDVSNGNIRPSSLYHPTSLIQGFGKKDAK